MSGISSGTFAIVQNATTAQFVSAQRLTVRTGGIQTISTNYLFANDLVMSGDVADIGTSTALFTIKARTINVGDSNSTVVVPNETKFVSQDTFSIPDPNFRMNYGNIQGIVSTGITVLSLNSTSQPAYMNIHSQLGWTLSCPTNRAKATQFTATSLVQTSVFEAVATTLSTASIVATGNLTVSRLSVTQADVYNLSIPYVSFPTLRVVSTASIGTLSATNVTASLLNFVGTMQISNTFTSTPSAISVLSATNIYASALLAQDLYNGVMTTKPNDVHVNTVGSIQHLRILSPVFVSDTMYATANTSILVAQLSTKTLNISTAATIVNLSIGTFHVSTNGTLFTPYALNIISMNGGLTTRGGAILSTFISGDVYVTSGFTVSRVHHQGLLTASLSAGGHVGNISYLYVSAPLSVLYQNTIGTASFTNLSVYGTLSATSVNVTNVSISGSAAVTNFYTTNLSVASEIVIRGTLSVNERVSTGPTVLGSTIEFKTATVTPGLRMEYGTITTATNGYADITFTRAFGTAPTVHIQALHTSTAFVWAAITNAPTTVGVTSVRTYVDHTPLSQIDVHWFAVGI